MITTIASKKIKEEGNFITYQMNTPIYDEKGLPTWTYDDSNPDIITIVRMPQFDDKN